MNGEVNSNVIFFTETGNDHGKFERHFLHWSPKWPWKIPTSFSDKLKMTIENSNVIFFTETQNEHGKFQRHFLHLNPKWPWKLPTSSSPLKPEFTVVFPLFDIPLKSLGQNYYFIFVIAKPKTNWILDIKAFYSP